MRPRARSLAIMAVVALSLTFTSFGAVSATAIDNFPGAFLLSAFGEPFAPYMAQTFTASPGVATDLAIQLVSDIGPDATEFHLLITDVSGSGPTFHPTNVLFESQTVTFPFPTPLTVVHIAIPGLVLEPGKTYAFILDAFVTRDGLDGRSLIATNGTYSDGAFYFNQGFAGSSRADHFADDWFFTEAIFPPDVHDLAFQMTFASSVPEPSSLLLLVAGLLLVTAGKVALR